MTNSTRVIKCFFCFFLVLSKAHADTVIKKSFYAFDFNDSDSKTVEVNERRNSQFLEYTTTFIASENEGAYRIKCRPTRQSTHGYFRRHFLGSREFASDPDSEHRRRFRVLIDQTYRVLVRFTATHDRSYYHWSAKDRAKFTGFVKRSYSVRQNVYLRVYDGNVSSQSEPEAVNLYRSVSEASTSSNTNPSYNMHFGRSLLNRRRIESLLLQEEHEEESAATAYSERLEKPLHNFVLPLGCFRVNDLVLTPLIDEVVASRNSEDEDTVQINAQMTYGLPQGYSYSDDSSIIKWILGFSWFSVNVVIDVRFMDQESVRIERIRSSGNGVNDPNFTLSFLREEFVQEPERMLPNQCTIRIL